MTRRGGTISPEAAENQLNILIERRAREAQDANHYAKAWAESVRRYNLRAAAERREAWRKFHERLAAAHQRIAEEHQAKALALEAEGKA